MTPDPIPVTRRSLLDDLRAIGIRSGDHVGVGVSLRSIGYVEGGPQTLIEALLDAVGPDGTIIMPAYSHMHPIRRLDRRQHVFDHAATPTYAGLVPETLRRDRRALRSRHPTCSIVAIGARAADLVEGHDESAPAYSPYSKLAAIGGKTINIGIGDVLIGLHHEAQHHAGLLGVLPPYMGVYVRRDDGSLDLFRRPDPGGCLTTLTALVDRLRASGLLHDGRIGHASTTCCLAEPALSAIAEMLRRQPELNLCGFDRCLWCREVERRLGLYDRLADRQYFQKSPLSRLPITLMNRARLAGYRWPRFEGLMRRLSHRLAGR